MLLMAENKTYPIIHSSGPRCVACPRMPESPKKNRCNSCHAAYMRNWRKTHKPQGEAALRANARAYLNVYVHRGKIDKLPCEICGGLNVEAHHEDYSKPLVVRWLCRGEHLSLTGAIERVRVVHRPAELQGGQA